VSQFVSFFQRCISFFSKYGVELIKNLQKLIIRVRGFKGSIGMIIGGLLEQSEHKKFLNFHAGVRI
jgi:hypothetical protein